AVGVRRLHDTDRSGWWLLAAYAPLILSMLLPLAGLADRRMELVLLLVAGAGSILLIILFVLEGTKGPNRYGPDPKGVEAGTAGAG
ncbi:MAG TPA: DUF805 domain-containing protein, partial [Allosphingosinicella sp.]|nr:DUF805 domain-containing protein [Allosphingosinicella sp.]